MTTGAAITQRSSASGSASLGGVAQRLIDQQLLNISQAMAAIDVAATANIPLLTHLLNQQILDSLSLAQAAAAEFAAPLLDLDAFDLQHCPQGLVDLNLISKYRVLPLCKVNGCLSLALCDPADLAALDHIKFHTGLSIDVIVVEQDKLLRAIEAFMELSAAESARLKNLDKLGLDDLAIEPSAIDEDHSEALAAAIDEAPIVRFVNKLLLDAVHAGASDIHIEPYEGSYRVRFRCDGILQEITRPPISIATRVAARLKIMAQMDISERRRPQDGRIKMRLSQTRTIDFRVSSLPTLWGEKIVLRLLDRAATQLGIDSLGLEEDQQQLFLEALNLAQGLILVSGPTGSGKTVSLYTGLSLLNTPERNISSAEDPVEINLEGINQVPINNRIGLGFATALRAFLRQDPDVLMVGEIRDLETAEIAVKAAQTGHLVLSTLHTNNASQTLSRLLNMGIPAYNLASSVTLVIAQRLLRRLCKRCKENVDIPEKVLVEEGFRELTRSRPQLFRATGCENCQDGYKGRIGIYEVVPINAALSRIIMDGADSIAIADLARQQGFNTLRQSALGKVILGLTSLEEANRLT